MSWSLSHTQLDYDHTPKSVRLLQHTEVPTMVQTHCSRVVKMLLNDVGSEPFYENPHLTLCYKNKNKPKLWANAAFMQVMHKNSNNLTLSRIMSQ